MSNDCNANDGRCPWGTPCQPGTCKVQPGAEARISDRLDTTEDDPERLLYWQRLVDEGERHDEALFAPAVPTPVPSPPKQVLDDDIPF